MGKLKYLYALYFVISAVETLGSIPARYAPRVDTVEISNTFISIIARMTIKMYCKIRRKEHE